MHTLILPSIHKGADVWAQEFVRLWLGAPWQQRQGAQPDDRLTAAAVWKAEDMRLHDRCQHIDTRGRYPHRLVRDYGYPLVRDWPDDLNCIESLCVAYQGPTRWIELAYNSPHHHDHLCGVGFFRNQVRYGVGCAEGGFMALITCPAETE